ncbi:hypothetical protein CC86DRAFT_432263 [Ophiobolus disseminans]|uniref:Uncharacterized protein n=1 Tax=Ophiobolus disseminans TaxID=1469910 RepID=A0A6A6ZDK8_9PLEO|nr:hypothetical protein CC86DRAFT_432263 [Ophiobolus disseminans]
MHPKRTPTAPTLPRVRRGETSTLKVTRRPARAPPPPRTNLNYKRAIYPWDDHQDDIIVNSIETAPVDGKPTGAEHYLQQLSRRTDEYRHVCSHPDEYRKLPKQDMFDDNVDVEFGNELEVSTGINYTRLPDPPTRSGLYTSRIYTATITNPAIFLAIVRVAQINIPMLDFVSGLNRLPNLPLDKAHPVLEKGVFPEDIPYKKSRWDVSMTFAFFPSFYADGRHALGYYHLHASTAHSPPMLTTCLFTPCSLADLKYFSLVEWLPGDVEEHMACVGGRDGAWLDKSVVEEWEGWKLAVKVVGSRAGWQGRLEGYFWKEEKGGRGRGRGA